MNKNLILLLLLVALISCGDKSREVRNQKIVTQKQNFRNPLNLAHKTLVNKILESDLKLKKTTVPAKNTILVVQKSKGNIVPYASVNKILEGKGYNVTYDSDKLEYIIVEKFKGIKSGTYSDGSNAWDLETNIYVIDTKTEKISLIESQYLKAPNKVEVSGNSITGNYGAQGRIRGNELAVLIIDKVLMKR